MYKLATITTVASIVVAASYFQTLETQGLFAIAWIGGFVFVASITLSKAFGMKP